LCALCGKNFLVEIITSVTVKVLEVDGCDQTLVAHDKCIEEYQGKKYLELPVGSPLRDAFEKALVYKK
jgi:hypothetical protein